MMANPEHESGLFKAWASYLADMGRAWRYLSVEVKTAIELEFKAGWRAHERHLREEEDE